MSNSLYLALSSKRTPNHLLFEFNSHRYSNPRFELGFDLIVLIHNALNQIQF